MDSLASLVDRQQTRLLQVHFPHGDGLRAGLLINHFGATEALSTDFAFTLELLSDDAMIELKDVMGKMITVELERASGEPRYFNGYVFDFRFLHSDGGYAAYGMTLRPWLAFLSRRTDNSLFHDQTTRQALEAIFADYAEKDVEFCIADGRGSVKIKEAHRFFGKCDRQMTSIQHATRKGRKPGGAPFSRLTKLNILRTLMSYQEVYDRHVPH